MPDGAATDSTPASFIDRLRLDPQFQTFALENAYTPPVPFVGAAPASVVVFAYRTRLNMPKSFYVLPPSQRLLADYPTARLRAVDAVTPQALGLAPDVDGAVGEVPIRSVTYDERVTADAGFARAERAVLDAFFARGAPPAGPCREWLAQLPDRASPALIPVLRRASPEFFAWLDRCVASGR